MCVDAYPTIPYFHYLLVLESRPLDAAGFVTTEELEGWLPSWGAWLRHDEDAIYLEQSFCVWKVDKTKTTTTTRVGHLSHGEGASTLHRTHSSWIGLEACATS